MAWLQLSVAVSRERAEAASACLEAHGAVAISLASGGEEELLEPGPGEQPLWTDVRLEALLDPATDLKVLRPALAATGARLVDAELIAEEDWQSRWRAHAVRACFAGRLWLLPRDEPFEAPPAVGAAPPAVLRLDPGLAFGSGSHPTTRLCLAGLAALPLAGARVLDYGCGSGVLAIAAALLGAREVVAVDHDPQALLATRDNASYNHLDPKRLRVATPDELAQSDFESARGGLESARGGFESARGGLESARGGFDIVVANILANPLVALAPVLTAHTAPRGRLLLSGLLEEQEQMIRDAYPEMTFSPPAREAGWIRLDGQRQPATWW